MRSILSIICCLFTMFSFPGLAQSKQVYGKGFKETKLVKAANLPSFIGSKDSIAVMVTGQVKEVCQAKGCWMDIQLADNSVMKVRFKDYAFFVPKNIAGKTVVINGMAYNQAVSVADQKHYAEDAGKPKAEIAAITKPKKSLTFMASGVKIK